MGAVWNGIFYMRSVPDFSNTNPTQSQLNIRIKLALVMGFFKHIKSLIKIGYQQFTDGVTPMNAATSYHLKNAVSGVAPDYTINYSKVKFSVGDLDGPANYQVASVVATQLDFLWDAEASILNGSDTDQLTVLTYNEAKDRYCIAPGVAPRSAGLYSMMLPNDWAGDEANIWMGFVSENGKKVSNSVYIGVIPVL